MIISWGIKHRPSTLDGYVFPNDQYKEAFTNMVKQQSFPHLLLSGVQGSGKTTIAKILINSMPVDPTLDVKQINASDQNSVDDMRTEITDFINSYPMGDFKIVLLEEADYLSLNAQALLRVPLEDPDNTARFILTCNHEHKIITPLKSRLTHFHFKTQSYDNILLCAVEVLAKEKIKFNLDTVKQFIDLTFPDIRKLLNTLQQHCTTGTLILPTVSKDKGDYKGELANLLAKDNWRGARELVCSQVLPSEWEEVYRYLYDNIHTFGKFKQIEKAEQAYVLIAEHLFKHTGSADPEINAAALFVRLSIV